VTEGYENKCAQEKERISKFHLAYHLLILVLLKYFIILITVLLNIAMAFRQCHLKSRWRTNPEISKWIFDTAHFLQHQHPEIQHSLKCPQNYNHLFGEQNCVRHNRAFTISTANSISTSIGL
jgi:hypothetical protein